MSRKPHLHMFDPSDGMEFFVLGEQGILFCEQRQELHLLDAAASYVWCSLRDGLGFDEIVSDYADACGMTAQEARHTVGVLLHRWLGLDYIRGPDIPDAPPIGLTTALGRLLVNRRLRDAFAVDPQAVARRLRLRDEDVPVFAGLDPAQLAELASSLQWDRKQDVKSRLAEDEAVARSAVLRYRTRAWTAPPIERFYRLSGTVLRLRFDTAEQENAVHRALTHLEVPKASPDVGLDAIAEARGHVILKAGGPAAWCPGLAELTRTILVLVRDIVLRRSEFFLMIHGALVSTGGACVLLPAASGSGKSTLTAALIRSGFRFFTDEIALLDEKTLGARPFPFPIVVKNGSVEPLKPFYPEIDGLPVTYRYNNQPIRFLPPRASDLPHNDEVRQPVRWIVFPRYDAAADTVLKPIAPEAALGRMFDECRLVDARLTAPNVTTLIEWFRGVDCYDLTLSSLADAIPLMQRLCGVNTVETADA